MNATRLWTLGSIVAIVALLVGTWFAGISPRLAEAATANTERTSVEFLNAKHAATLEALRVQFADISDLNADLDDIRAAIPATDDTAELFRQLHTLAGANGITVEEVTLSLPERFVAPAEPPADTQLAAALGSLTPENFLAVELEQTVLGTYAGVMNYIAALQSGERAYLIYDITMDAGMPAADTVVEVKFTGQVFVLLDGVAAGVPEEAAVPTEGAALPE